MDLPKLEDLDVSGKRVIVRVDLDVPFNKIVGSNGAVEYKIEDKTRIKTWYPTIKYLLDKKASQIILIGHIGRPQEGGERISTFAFFGQLGRDISFWPDSIESGGPLIQYEEDSNVHLLENLRFYEGEESNSPEFAKKLASFGDIYINEAFASSHRNHASIVELPKLLPHAVGIHFAKEVENLSKVFENPERPLVILISGIKKDKLEMIKPLSNLADKVLVGGRLPEFLGDEGLVSVRLQADTEKIIIGNLNQDKEDITLNTIDRFIEEIGKAKTVVLAGVLGKYEDDGHRQGTERVFKAVADSSAFKIVGGGDSLAAVSFYSLESKFDWISVGGGAMLEFLVKKTLPGIEAIL